MFISPDTNGVSLILVVPCRAPVVRRLLYHVQHELAALGGRHLKLEAISQL